MIQAKYQTFARRFWAGILDGLVLMPLAFIDTFVWSSHERLPVAVLLL